MLLERTPTREQLPHLTVYDCLNLTFFARLKKKDFPCFCVGPEPSPKLSPAGCIFSTRKSRSEVRERGDFGEEKCLGKGGADGTKKGTKDAQKKVGFNASFRNARSLKRTDMMSINAESGLQNTSVFLEHAFRHARV